MNREFGQTLKYARKLVELTKTEKIFISINVFEEKQLLKHSPTKVVKVKIQSTLYFEVKLTYSTKEILLKRVTFSEIIGDRKLRIIRF